LGPTHTAVGLLRFHHYPDPLDLDCFASLCQGRYVSGLDIRLGPMDGLGFSTS